jgi:NTP pyrophosphatase (non-canonical NTP hydrolase)
MEYISQDKINKYVENIKRQEFVWDKDQRFFHLMEEVGELSEMYLQFTKKKKPFKNLDDIENGLADVFDDILALSILFNLDINNVIEKSLDNEA